MAKIPQEPNARLIQSLKSRSIDAAEISLVCAYVNIIHGIDQLPEIQVGERLPLRYVPGLRDFTSEES